MNTGKLSMEHEMDLLKESTVDIHYFSTKYMEHRVIESCEADLAIIINAVAYYAQAMSEFLETNNLSVCGKYHIESQLTRAKNVQKYLEEQTGYSRDEAIARCRNRSGQKLDTGEDAFTLTAGKHNSNNKAS